MDNTKAFTGPLEFCPGFNKLRESYSGTALLEQYGSSTTPLTDATASGEAVSIYVNPTATTGRYNALHVQAKVGAAGAAGCYAIRGLVGVKTGITLTATGQTYLAAVQGKLQLDGTIANAGGVYACAVLAQVGTGGTYSAATQVYALWVDNQRATGAEGLFHMVNITNNGGVVDNVFKIYGNNNIAVFADIENLGGGAVVAAGTYSTADGYLVVKVQGDTYRIPFFTGTD